MPEPIDIATLRAVAGIVGALLAGILWRLEGYGKATVRLETTMEHVVDRVEKVEKTIQNGLTEKLNRLGEDITNHMAGEEQRIMDVLHRNPLSRTRRGDRQRP